MNFTGFSDHLTADYSGQTAQFFAEASYGFDFEQARLSPFVNMAYVYTHTDSFTEKGGDAALTGTGGRTDHAFQTIGLRLEDQVDIDEAKVTVGAMVGWQHLYGDTTPDATLAFASSNKYNIDGASLARDAFVFQTGAKLDMTSDITLGAAYSGQLAAGVQNHTLSLDLNMRF